jgi:hypothetical protein
MQAATAPREHHHGHLTTARLEAFPDAATAAGLGLAGAAELLGALVALGTPRGRGAGATASREPQPEERAGVASS